MKITIYSTPTCGPCRSIKHMLDQNNLKYTIINRDEGNNAAELERVSGGRMVPVTIINDGTTEHVIKGGNIPMIKKVLGL
jgi:glutaredoxin